MPESKAERLREQAAENGAPDPVQQDFERADQVDQHVDEAEAEAAETPR